VRTRPKLFFFRPRHKSIKLIFKSKRKQTSLLFLYHIGRKEEARAENERKQVPINSLSPPRNLTPAGRAPTHTQRKSDTQLTTLLSLGQVQI